jgi:putative Ca2+/H+ antiporter (TMEM165/GDT1 family)
MDKKLFLTVFASVFLAEIGDKTQLATMLFASNSPSAKWTVFLGSALALVVAAGIGVAVGDVVSKVVSPRTLSIAAGIGFVAIGAWTLAGALRTAS